MKINSHIDIFPLLPKGNLWDFPTINPKKNIFSPNKLTNTLLDILNIRLSYIQLKNKSIGGEKSEEDYSDYLQFPNIEIKSLASTIVNRFDSNDEKAYKILRWVQENIEYKSDVENYGMNEFWAYPTLTLKRKFGDCEDGAFLIHSLMLNAGVPWDRIRTYGGIVRAGETAETGGHAWTAYKRESDDKWVILDWCYLPTTEKIDERKLMEDDLNYIDDIFYVNAIETIETPYTNGIRNIILGSVFDRYV